MAEMVSGKGNFVESASEKYIEYLNVFSSFVGDDILYAAIAICTVVAIVSFMISQSHDETPILPFYLPCGFGLGTSISFSMDYSLYIGVLFAVVGTVILIIALPSVLVKAMGKAAR